MNAGRMIWWISSFNVGAKVLQEKGLVKYLLKLKKVQEPKMDL